jgi:acylphosphatase
MNVHINILISGYVQGVGFRYHTRKNALSFNLTGFVRNNPDGSVYTEVEGEEAMVNKFVDWCSKGPSMAEVENIKIEASPLKGFSSFEIQNDYF